MLSLPLETIENSKLDCQIIASAMSGCEIQDEDTLLNWLKDNDEALGVTPPRQHLPASLKDWERLRGQLIQQLSEYYRSQPCDHSLAIATLDLVHAEGETLSEGLEIENPF